MGEVQTARCVYCREDIAVPATYAHGDHIKCGACGTKHKVVRGDRLRLVLADVAPLKDALAQNEQLVDRLEAELAHARGELRHRRQRRRPRRRLHALPARVQGRAPERGAGLGNAAGIALVTGLLLEVANFLFLAKRQAMIRISAELEEAEEEGRACASRSARPSRV